eukprot:1376701-Amorphochlora_amoeboformis.AAC.1
MEEGEDIQINTKHGMEKKTHIYKKIDDQLTMIYVLRNPLSCMFLWRTLYLKTQGEEIGKDHPVKKELERVQK